MYKKILCVSMLALGLNAAALADDFGGGDFASGGGNSSGSEFSSDSSSNSNSGIYFGGQIGATNLHYRGSSYTTSNSSYDDTYKLAARGYLGYAFTQFISTELGYDYYGRPKFKNTNGNTQDILQQGMDLVVKANLPLDYGFGLYIKGGMAWVYRSALHNNANTFAEKGAGSKFTPVAGIGINYWFAPNMALDLSWAKTMTVSDLPTIDLITLGFIYKINI